MARTRTVVGALLVAALVDLAGCGGGGRPPATTDTSEGTDARPAEASAEASAGGEANASSAAPSATATGDAPEISRSAGEQGGVVVFWPRVVPRTDDAATRELAGKVQARLAELAARATPKATRDVRPEPERVCPKTGCQAMTVGVLLTSRDGGCAAIALVSAPGQAPAKLVAWAGAVELKKAEVPFREPPESSIVIKDMVSCAKLMEQLDKGEADVVRAITEAAGGS